MLNRSAMGWWSKGTDRRLEALEGRIERLMERLEERRESPAPQTNVEAFAPVLAAFADMAKGLLTSLGQGQEAQSRAMQTMFERAAKRELRLDYQELGKKSGEARRAKRDRKVANDPERVFLAEVFSNCAECEARITLSPSKTPADLARHLTEGHDSTIIPNARRIWEKLAAEETPLFAPNGKSALS